MDFTELLNEKDREPMTALFYCKRPVNPSDNAITFRYERINPRSRVYATLARNIRADSETYMIKTNDACGFNIGGYVSTQDGTFWQIEEILHDEQTKGAEESLLLFKTAVGTEYSMRLVKVQNPWGIGTW